MTDTLYSDDAYLTQCTARVLESGPEGLVLDRTVFYPLGGGQPGDRGVIEWDDRSCSIVDTRRRREDGAIVHRVPDLTTVPPVGTEVTARIDWELRYRHMRMHTCLHLLGAVLEFPVTGGNISAEKSRLDFDMPESADKDEVTVALNALIAADHSVESRWIDEADLDPALIRTLSVQPPSGVGSIRLLDIPGVDLQPCGGTHVRRTGEIGPASVIKIEKKGRQNRRVHVVLDS
jgi:misacylated tRNA(Ala) deacylase